MSAKRGNSIEMFLIYASEDAQYAEEMKKHLKYLDNVSIWDMKDTTPGGRVEEEVMLHLQSAHILPLLLSPDFPGNDEQLQKIDQYITEHLETGGQLIVPIMIRPYLIEKTIFERLRVLPIDKKPIAHLKRREEAYVHVARELLRVIESRKNEIPALPDQVQIDSIQSIQDEQKTVIYFQSIEKKYYLEKEDYLLSWSKYFVPSGDTAGYQLKKPSNWNKVLLKQLKDLKQEINLSPNAGALLRIYGPARLCCWLAFGFVFRETSNYILDCQQQGTFWRTDEPANDDLVERIVTTEEVLAGAAGNAVAIGIDAGVGKVIDKDIRAYLARCNEQIAAIQFLSIEKMSEGHALKGAGDATALAFKVKRSAQDLVKRWSARKLLLFYAGPSAGACFIGYRLNAVAPAIEIMEFDQSSQEYIPTFLLQP